MKDLCDLALKETCQHFNMLNKVGNLCQQQKNRIQHFRSIEGGKCLSSATMAVRW